MKKISAHKTGMVAGTLLVLFAMSSTAQAQHGHLGHGYHGGYQHISGCQANVQWPRMFIPPARRSVCATYAAMVNNGWRRQNLLGDYHFNKDTNALTDAGKLKVNWILTQAPPQHRQVFVQRGVEELQTTARVAAVQDFASNMSPGVGPVNVNDTHLVAEGHAAGAVDSVFTGYQANRPPPVLPASSGGAASAGASQ